MAPVGLRCLPESHVDTRLKFVKKICKQVNQVNQSILKSRIARLLDFFCEFNPITMRVPALVTLLVVQCGLTFRVDPEAEPIYILSCVKNLAQFNHRMAHLARMFDSVIRTAQRRPLHWIMPALPADVPMIDFLLQRIIQEHARVPVQVNRCCESFYNKIKAVFFSNQASPIAYR